MCYSNMSTRWPQKVLKSRKIAVAVAVVVAVAVWATFMSNDDWKMIFELPYSHILSIWYILIYGHLNCICIRLGYFTMVSQPISF